MVEITLDQVPKIGAALIPPCELPLDIEIRSTSDAGTPIVASQPDSAHAQSYRAIAGLIWDKIEERLGSTARQAPKIVMQ